MQLTREQQVFLNLLSSSVHHTPISDVALNAEEWKAVFTLAKIHNVLPLVFEKASELNAFSDSFSDSRMMIDVMTSVAAQARRTAEFLALYKNLQQAGFAPVVMKGIICRQLYGDYCDHRPSGDEDVLIRKCEFEAIQQIFVENGYICEQDHVTAEQLNELQEITFYNAQAGLSIEVHINPMGRDNDLRDKMNDYFVSVFDRSKTVCINDICVNTMNETDHYLFLVLHAFKHFTASGFGIRQVLDILLFQQQYGFEIDWNYIKASLKEMRADGFWSDLIHIGNSVLGFHLSTFGERKYPEELLQDLLGNGVFGNATQAQRTASQMTSAAVREGMDPKCGKIRLIFKILFPTQRQMLNRFPELQEKPWLLPVRWVQRWGRFLVHSKESGGTLAAESMKIGQRRIELLKKYDIL